MTRKTRRNWALVILLLGLPAYIVGVVSLIALFPRPSMLLQLAIYIGLGVIWALPFRFIFRGVAQPDQDDTPKG